MRVWGTYMKGINDIHKCNPCTSGRRGEFNNIESIATPIVGNYL
jgi:hypothetical protein